MLFSIAINTIIVSLSLLIWSLRGKRYAIPAACRVCNFDVASTIAPDTHDTVCPECVRSPSAPDAKRTRRRRHRYWAASLSVLTLLLGVGMFAPRSINAQALKSEPPRVSDSTLAESIANGGPQLFPGAVDEAYARCMQANVSHDTLQSLARAALARQQSSLAWDTRLGEIIERAYDAGTLTSQEGTAYFQQGLEVSVTPLVGVTPGQASWEVRVSRTRMGPPSRRLPDGGYSETSLRDLTVDLVLCDASLDGAQVYPYKPSDPRHSWVLHCPMNGGNILNSTSISFVHSVDAPLLDGAVTAVINYDLIIGDSSKPMTFVIRVPITSSTPDMLERISDPEIEAKFRQAFKIDIVRYWSRANPDGTVPTNIRISYYPAKVPLRARIGFRLNRDFLERSSNYCWYTALHDRVEPQDFTPQSMSTCLDLTAMMDPTWTASAADITLLGRGDATEAFTKDASECFLAGAKLPVWTGRITIPNVPIWDIGRPPQTPTPSK